MPSTVCEANVDEAEALEEGSIIHPEGAVVDARALEAAAAAAATTTATATATATTTTTTTTTAPAPNCPFCYYCHD